MIKKIIRFIFPVKGDSKGEVVRKLISIGLAVVLIVCVVIVAGYYINSYENAAKNKHLQSVFSSAPSSALSSKYPAGMLTRFYPFYDENHDVKGWITIPSTVINYPVVEAKDNSFYLTNGFDKTPDHYGALFLDFRDSVKPMSQNLIIYGHDMQDGQMFKALRKYEEASFYNTSPVITFDTIYGEQKWKIFAGFIANTVPSQGYVFNYLITDFGTQDDFMSYVNEAKARSIFSTGVDVQPGDTILTLSTCTYEYNDARFVLMARMVRPGESLSVTPGTVNKTKVNPLQPMK
jgi:sortase B